MAEEKQDLLHFKWGGNPSHSDVSILPNGQDISFIVIDHIEAREDEMVNGVKKDMFVAVFKDNPYTKLPMALNKVNKERLLKLAGQDEWHLLAIKNLPVRLTYEPTKLGNGLRISKLPPTIPSSTTNNAQGPSKKVLDDTMLTSANKFLETKTIAELEQYYVISEEMKAKLTPKP